MHKAILSICSGDAFNEINFFKDKELDPDTSFILYDPIYKDSHALVRVICETFFNIFPGHTVHFCRNVNEVKDLLKTHIPIHLIGFNIQELYPIPHNETDILSYIKRKKQELGLLSICDLISIQRRNIKVHIQMKDHIVFDNFYDFHRDLVINE